MRLHSYEVNTPLYNFCLVLSRFSQSPYPHWRHMWMFPFLPSQFGLRPLASLWCWGQLRSTIRVGRIPFLSKRLKKVKMILLLLLPSFSRSHSFSTRVRLSCNAWQRQMKSIMNGRGAEGRECHWTVFHNKRPRSHAPDRPRHRHVISHCVCSLCVLWYSDVDKVGVVFEFH